LSPLYILSIITFSIVFVWSTYNGLILATGIFHSKLNSKFSHKKISYEVKNYPMISIIIPVKNEEKVIGRCLDAFLKIDYPHDKMEIIIVEDGSIDRTIDICMKYTEKYPNLIKFLHKSVSNGKPSALNFGLKYARGEIIGIFDADSMPESDILKKVAFYFDVLKVDVLQGKTLPINTNENILTKIISYEDFIKYEGRIKGKEILKLFVPLTGSCYFIKKKLILDIGGWNENCLSEDTELAVKLLEKGIKIKYADDIICWQENPSKIKAFYKQRKRWLRGTMEAAIKYGRLIKKLSKENIDAEMTLIGPFISIPYLLSYLLAIYFIIFPYEGILVILAQLFIIASILASIITGIILSIIIKPRRKSNILLIPLIYVYWIIQTIIALHSFIDIIIKRPIKWERTEKSGISTLYMKY
jgi:cellulose synthase/poly-beta-1,6-N-acetylglucosamine synthase-like glycosyltransferase